MKSEYEIAVYVAHSRVHHFLHDFINASHPKRRIIYGRRLRDAVRWRRHLLANPK